VGEAAEPAGHGDDPHQRRAEDQRLGARRPSIGGADFCVEWDGTVDEILALLTKNGIKPEAGPGPRSCARGTSTSVYFRDPDDNLVELTVYP
jgi:catechol 2,3-dioxygenase-like lactoylglutathione lyase family enzyme